MFKLIEKSITKQHFFFYIELIKSSWKIISVESSDWIANIPDFTSQSRTLFFTINSICWIKQSVFSYILFIGKIKLKPLELSSFIHKVFKFKLLMLVRFFFLLSLNHFYFSKLNLNESFLRPLASLNTF